jgi:hypothetical protein
MLFVEPVRVGLSFSSLVTARCLALDRALAVLFLLLSRAALEPGAWSSAAV